MRRLFPRVPIRRFLMLGAGVAVLSTAGFAYMASNSAPVTSAGEGSAAVTGYAVTDVSYNGDSGSGCGAMNGCYITSIQFTLTANDGSSQNHGMPDFVYAAIFNSGGHNVANADGCTIPAGAVNGAGQWTGTFDCSLNPSDTPTQATVGNVTNYDITATQ
jgi:hypothetical protein